MYVNEIDWTNLGDKRKKSFANDQEIPYHPLLVFEGTIEGIPCRILKDDGASTNIISTTLYESHKEAFSAQPSDVLLSHSSSESKEMHCGLIDKATVYFDGHEYCSKMVVGHKI